MNEPLNTWIRSNPPSGREQLASQLKTILNQGLSGYLSKLSSKPEGDLEDGLKPNRERIGVAKTSSENL